VKQRLEKRFQEKVNGKVVLITGASSGIGLTAAHRLAGAGAHVLLVARTKETLDEVKAEIEAKGGQASVFPCDLNDMNSIDEVSKQILASVDHIDILINNAGRSIRRAVHESTDRFHDLNAPCS
jgi:short-subunit dehydrogenase